MSSVAGTTLILPGPAHSRLRCKAQVRPSGDDLVPAGRLLGRLFPNHRSIIEAQPGREPVRVSCEVNDARPSGESLASVGVVSRSPTIAEADAVMHPPEVVDVIVADKGADHIAHFDHGREQPGVEARTAYVLELMAVAYARIP